MKENTDKFEMPNAFVPAFARRDVPSEKINRFRGHLPDALLEFWQEYGWCGYAKGLFWTVDPDEWERELNLWLSNTHFKKRDTYYIIGRSAFGKLILWGEHTGQSLKIDTSCGLILPIFDPDFSQQESNQIFLNFINTLHKRDFDKMDENRTPLFERVLKKLGVLDHNSMYGFSPSLAEGGPLKLENLHKLDAHVHLEILSQVTEIQILREFYEDKSEITPAKMFTSEYL